MHEQPLRLYSYWRSSAAWRVRIALHLKRLEHETVPVHLLRDGGQQHRDDYVALNPQQLVPTLRHGERVIRQSLAIIEYLDELWPQPALLPGDAWLRSQARGMALLVACDIHPLNNLRVQQYIEREWHVPAPAREDAVRHWIATGFDALEAWLRQLPEDRFCLDDAPTLADCCLVPQAYNARRFGLDVAVWPRIAAIERACMALPAFIETQPERQPDAPA